MVLLYKMPKSAILGGKLFFYSDKMFFSVLEAHMTGQIFRFILKELECSPISFPSYPQLVGNWSLRCCCFFFLKLDTSKVCPIHQCVCKAFGQFIVVAIKRRKRKRQM